MNINNAMPIPLPTPTPTPTPLRNAVAGLSIEERRLLMRHYLNGGIVQDDVQAHKENIQKNLEAKITAFSQGLLQDQQQMQVLIDELIDGIEDDNPFEEIQVQNEIIKESIGKVENIAFDLQGHVEKTRQELQNESQKKKALIKLIESYTEQVIRAKKQSSNRDAAIENVSTLSNIVIAKMSKQGKG